MSTPAYKDLFSGHAGDYARHRPTYPAALFEWLAAQAPARHAVWDCGTGNGQAALALAAHFDEVLATDPSEKQIGNAAAHPRVRYTVAPAESSGLAAASADAITVAQAFHWFRHDGFFTEARRVGRPRAVLAFWCYELAHVTPAVDEAVLRFYRGTLGPHWEPERRLVEEGYRSVQLPADFAGLTVPRFEMTAEWSCEDFIGYLGTWSALQKYRKVRGEDPLPAFGSELRGAWGQGGTPRTVRWPLSLRAARLP